MTAETVTRVRELFGRCKPARGAASPVRPALRDYVRGLVAADGTLPVWSKWLLGDPTRAALVGIDILAGDPLAFTAFEQGLPAMRVDWFDKTIELASWDQVLYPRTLNAKNVLTRLAIEPGWLAQLLAFAAASRLARLLATDAVSGAFAALRRHRASREGALFALRVEVTHGGASRHAVLLGRRRPRGRGAR